MRPRPKKTPKTASTKTPSRRHASTRPASRKPVQKPTGHERPAQATTTGRKHPPKRRQLDASTRQKPQLLDTSANHNDQTTPGCRKKHHETLREPARNPKKPQEAPRNPKNPIGHKRRPRQAPRSPKRPQGTPECHKKPASTKFPSRMHASTRHASQKLPTGQLNTSARPGHDYWTQAPPKRATTGRTRPSKTTIIVHKHQPQRPRRPRMPQETSGNSTRTRQEPQETTRGPRKPQEVPRTQASNKKCVANLGSPRSMHESPRR